MKYLYIAFLLIALLSSSAFSDDTKKTYYNDRERGWYWYETPPIEVEEPEEKPKEQPAVVIQSAQPLSPKEVIDKQREVFNNALAAAVINPTPENIRNYLAITQQINAQAERFSDSFKKTIWVSPEYDYRLSGRPTSTQAIAAYNQNQVKEKYSDLYQIAEQKGIIYFFKSNCPYCARFSPILKQFAAQFGFTVIPVSMDGKGTQDYPYPKHSDFMASRLNVSVVPAVFLVNPDANVVSTIGYGYSDWTTLISKVLFANEQMENDGTDNRIVLEDVR
jgi:conjugal transfer pilus assembly protein TraF